MKPTEHQRKFIPRWLVGTIHLALAFLGLAVGVILSPATDTTYLELQSESDGAHRFMILILPGCLAAGIALVLCLFFFKKPQWLRNALQLMWGCTVATTIASLTFIIGFDRLIEHQGAVGQMVRSDSAESYGGRKMPMSGPCFERVDGVSGSACPLPDGGVLWLDENSLARKSPDGTTLWNQPRPGRPPGSLVFAHETVFYAGISHEYDDDAVVAALDPASGIRHWTFHCLGNGIAVFAIDDENAYFLTDRPALASVYRLRLFPPEAIWSVRLKGNLTILPRISSSGIEVASDEKILVLDPKTGKHLRSFRACGPGKSNDVICDQGKIVAWKTGEHQ